MANELDSNGRPMLLKVRVLKSTESDGLALVDGAVMKVILGIALKLIRLGIVERRNKRKSGSRKRKAIAEKKARLAIQAIAIESVV